MGSGVVAFSHSLARAAVREKSKANAFDLQPARLAIARWLPRQLDQFELELLPSAGIGDRLEIAPHRNRILLRGTSIATVLTALHWYLKYTANAHISWAGSQLELPAILPPPSRRFAVRTRLPCRYVLNDTDDGYSGPYRDWNEWERMLDILAFHGFNSVLVTVGQELVYYRLLRQLGYGDAEARAWIPAPAHQPWWLLQNMEAFTGPISTGLLRKRAELGRRIVRRLRELDMTPVLPGYAGMVPPDFGKRNSDAPVVPQGEWEGFQRPGWLDPTSPAFARVAGMFYSNQRELFGESTLYKMDLLHEGGRTGRVPLGAAARAVQTALLKVRPDATWVILGWLKNPRAELLAGVDREKVLVVDGLSDRYAPAPDRERDWGDTPYGFGSIPNFGGHTTIGAKVDAWQQRFFRWRDKPASKLRGIAYMPEGAYRDPAAFEAFSELAWREGPIDPDTWFQRYATFRYGGKDMHAQAAWRALGRSAYKLKQNQFSEAADSLFAARPALDVATAATWSPTALGYDPREMERALYELLHVAPRFRKSDAYRYDLVDVGRQCLANRARIWLPQIRTAFERRDRAAFRQLLAHWLLAMRLSERLLATHRSFLLGPWIAAARSAAGGEAESAQLEYDARSILTTWGPRAASNDGELHDYANRELAGLMRGLYVPRWRRYFDTLDRALESGREPQPIDWFAMEDAWAHARDVYPTEISGQSYGVATQVRSFLEGS